MLVFDEVTRDKTLMLARCDLKHSRVERFSIDFSASTDRAFAGIVRLHFENHPNSSHIAVVVYKVQSRRRLIDATSSHEKIINTKYGGCPFAQGQPFDREGCWEMRHVVSRHVHTLYGERELYSSRTFWISQFPWRRGACSISLCGRQEIHE